MARSNRTGVRGLYKDADGRYRIDLRYKDRSGAPQRHKEILPLGTTAGAAKLRAQEVLTASIAGTLTRLDAETPVTFGAALDKYRELCEADDSDTAKRDRKRHCARLVETIGAPLPIIQISDLTIQKHKSARKAAGLSPGGINRELSTLRHFLNRAVKWGWLDRAPKVELLPEPPGRVRWLSDAERTRIEKELGVRRLANFRRLVHAALLCGQRLGNLCTLRKSAVDFKHQTVTLVKTKSGKTIHVPISEALAKVLREAMAASGDRSEYVFTSGRFKKPYTSSGVTSLWRRIVERAGVHDLHFHDLRHDFATRVRRAGHGLDVIQALLGHASVTTTARYAHLGRAELQAAVNAPAAAIAPVLPPAKSKRARKPYKNR